MPRQNDRQDQGNERHEQGLQHRYTVRQVTNIQAGGGLYAQRIVTRRHYDLDGAKRAALRVAGLAEGS